MGMKQNIGNIGEEIATAYLERRGYVVVTRNYRRKWGEIDIIATKGNSLRFVEVKTISRENDVTTYNPLENVHAQKRMRIRRTAEGYIREHNYDGQWGIDVIAIELDHKIKQAQCEMLHDVL